MKKLFPTMFVRVCLITLMVVFTAADSPLRGEEKWDGEVWMIQDGISVFELETWALKLHDVLVQPLEKSSPDWQYPIQLEVSDRSPLELIVKNGIVRDVASGQIAHDRGLVIFNSQIEAEFERVEIRLTSNGSTAIVVGFLRDAEFALFDVSGLKVAYDRFGHGLFLESGEVAITQGLADLLGRPRLAGRDVGAMRVQATMIWTDGDEPLGVIQPGEVDDEGGVAGGNNGTNCWNNGEPLIGPDVIVGVIDSICNYDTVGSIDAFSIGTVSCNIGSSNLSWQASPDPDHPVIGQNLFKLKNGRFEHIGQSWLKHGFTALTLDDCGCGCSGQGGSVLGVGCSDPYGCGLNGSQSGLGPKFQINPSTGVNPGPHDTSSGNSIYKRVQVSTDELEASSASVRYFGDAQYIAADDAAAGNSRNNASYIAVNITGGGANWNASLAGTTQREQAGIRAWKDTDPTVTETDVSISGDGLVIVAAKATDLGTGFWHYEYAVHNLNSDRSIGSFSVPIDVATSANNVGFHDVSYHSGEPYDGTDWMGAPGGGSVMWATTPFATDANANALRWGTLYNFRFDANRAPTTGLVTLGLFKPGSPASVTAMTVVPTAAPVACIDPAECSDGAYCTGVEDCVGGFCQSGPDPCPDLCDESLDACVECLSTFDCDDGLFCNGGETCSAGACVNGSNPCTLFCDEDSDTCTNCFTSADCDDDLFCNGAETCSGGTCVPAGGGVINGEFNGAAGWTSHTMNGGSVAYPNQLNVTGPNDDGAGFTWAGQSNVNVSGNLQFTLVSYDSTDSGDWDYPVMHIDGMFYGIDADGTIGSVTTCTNGSSGTINNDSQPMNVTFSIDVNAIAGPGPHTIGFGVCSVDGLFGGGNAVFDNVLPPVTAADPCVGQCCNEAADGCVPCNICGNGLVEGTEECDDANTIDGDGCSSACQLEPGGFPCPNGVIDCLLDPANNACNCPSCTGGVCTYVCGKFGDADCNGIINLDTILCVLAGFTDVANCPNSDVWPCGGNGIIDIDDILKTLLAFDGGNPCGCTDNTMPGQGAAPLCGSIGP